MPADNAATSIERCHPCANPRCKATCCQNPDHGPKAATS